MWRFAAMKTDDGYGVYDSCVNGWRSKMNLTEDEAHEQAMEMDVQYNVYGPRKPDTVRRLGAPQPVKVAEWHPGSVLDAWIKEDGQWWGRVRDPAGRLHWYPATDLHPDDTNYRTSQPAPATGCHGRGTG